MMPISDYGFRTDKETKHARLGRQLSCPGLSFILYSAVGIPESSKPEVS
jgi:hypothetical protein